VIGLVIVTHGRLGQELIATCELIVGPFSGALAVTVRREDGPEQVQAEIRKAVEAVGGDGDGVIVVADMFGGTPANMAIPLLDPGRVEVLTGVNLPMLLKFNGNRGDLPLPELAALLRTSGRQGIVLASELLKTSPGFPA
jgi:PTS system mannose-specific IIA component